MTNDQDTGRIVLQLSSTANDPITLDDARYRHLQYLEHGPYIYTTGSETEQILHSFSINQDDLDLLYTNAQAGLRLHFCREASGNLNIIAVPIGEDGQLNIKANVKGVRPIVNTLQPCPSLCSPPFSENSLNAWEANDQYYWMDPNEEEDGKTWFIKGDDDQKIYVEKPDDAPES